MEDRISIHVQDGVADVRLTRPAKKNALDFKMFAALGEAGERIAEMKNVRAVVLSGEGDAFCSGIDTSVFSSQNKPPPGMPKFNELVSRTHGDANFFQWAVWSWRQTPMPVIAAIRGVAFGGGFQLALGADMRIASPDARLSVMEIKWGLIPDMCGIQLMRRLAREDVVREMVYTGRILTAEEAHVHGFVTRVADDPHAEAMKIAREIADKNPHAVRAAKRLMNLTADANADALKVLVAEAAEQEKLLMTPNQIEAIMSNMAKRPPNFVDPK